ncbi:preprotein translocase subunit SecG [Neoehrlichia mikurensis]|nr:preprotein translocase subunit SecG [Neoehrlichia mikurensis]QXK93218.1 preprotein translocase subunit SecG [Neoehrlichia mikurensis]QXK94066.1 preprotein translocase subunit SecG [Neoehrlichia mikurensis]
MFLTIIQIFLVFLLVVLVLLQPPESDSLSSFSSAQYNLGSIFTKSSSSSLINKLTGVIAAAFIINTLLLVGMNSKTLHENSIANEAAADKKSNNTSNTEEKVPFYQ